jgi:hypothetical protein
VFDGTVGAGGVFTQTHAGVAQSVPGAAGQHGCAGEFVKGIEAQTAIAFNRRAAVSITRPNFILAFMASFGALTCTCLTNI